MRFSWKPNLKQKKMVGGLAVVLVLAVAFRVVTERAFFAQASIEGAFSILTPEQSEGTVTLTGRYLPPPYGFSEEKLLKHFADKIGLAVDGEIREVQYTGRTEYVYEKEAAEAHSVVKVVYLTEEEAYYLCTQITLTGKNATGVSAFQKSLKGVANELSLKEIATTLELCGSYTGELPLATKDAFADRLLQELYAQPVYENRENANYTVYAYTGAVEEYLVVEKQKINVQVAIYYDRVTDCTEVVLASPIGLR